MSDMPQPEEKKGGAPAWLTTFSDLMSLLLCFFVLLVAMSEIKIRKFQAVSSSLRQAFSGLTPVQLSESNAIMAPPINTAVKMKNSDNPETQEEPKDGEGEDKNTSADTDSEENTQQKKQQQSEQQRLQDSLTKEQQYENEKEFKEMVEKLIVDVKEEIEQGKLMVERYSDRILIRFPADATFGSGSAELTNSIYPVLRNIGQMLANTKSHVVVGGHTDSLPISNFRYRSNWDLSSARAASVAEEIIRSGSLSSQRIEVIGYADGKPLASNATAQNRAMNRRVEISIMLDGAPDKVFSTKDGESPLIIMNGGGTPPNKPKTSE